MGLVVPAQYPGFDQCLFKLVGANMNVTTDQPFSYVGDWRPTNYLITAIRVMNASIDLDTAEGGVYQAASKAGDPIVAAAQAYSALDATDKALDLTLAAEGKAAMGVVPILSLTTGQGAAATADFYIFGRIMVGV